MVDSALSQHSSLLTLSLELSGAQTDGVLICLVKQTFLFLTFLQPSIKKSLRGEENKNEYNDLFPLRPILIASTWHKGFSGDVISDA